MQKHPGQHRRQKDRSTRCKKANCNNRGQGKEPGKSPAKPEQNATKQGFAGWRTDRRLTLPPEKWPGQSMGQSKDQYACAQYRKQANAKGQVPAPVWLQEALQKRWLEKP